MPCSIVFHYNLQIYKRGGLLNINLWSAFNKNYKLVNDDTVIVKYDNDGLIWEY